MITQNLKNSVQNSKVKLSNYPLKLMILNDNQWILAWNKYLSEFMNWKHKYSAVGVLCSPGNKFTHVSTQKATFLALASFWSVLRQEMLSKWSTGLTFRPRSHNQTQYYTSASFPCFESHFFYSCVCWTNFNICAVFYRLVALRFRVSRAV
jgi:hypothetical protein